MSSSHISRPFEGADGLAPGTRRRPERVWLKPGKGRQPSIYPRSGFSPTQRIFSLPVAAQGIGVCRGAQAATGGLKISWTKPPLRFGNAIALWALNGIARFCFGRRLGRASSDPRPSRFGRMAILLPNATTPGSHRRNGCPVPTFRVPSRELTGWPRGRAGALNGFGSNLARAGNLPSTREAGLVQLLISPTGLKPVPVGLTRHSHW